MITKTHKNLIITAIVLFIILIILSLHWIKVLNKAHSTFEDYYAFRGCTELVERTDTYGVCKLKSGTTIKIVKFSDKWYLDGDLPYGAKVTNDTNTQNTNQTTQLEYTNTDYGFTFMLPASWQGYTIVADKWEGNTIDTDVSQKMSGPKILIRHPLWTTDNQRQDIPVLIFSLSQWDLILAEKLSVSAAPIPPSELGRNAKYVFALPARYNFAYQTGFEEVQKIIEGKPLKGF